MELQQIENRITTRESKFAGVIIFDNMRLYSCPRCGSVTYFYDGDQLAFVTTHKNSVPYGTEAAILVPRCRDCVAEYNHMFRAVDLMRRLA
jgi:hypothetical protein